MTDKNTSQTERIIYFDGVCNLCNGFVQFVIKRDPEARFRFTPLQSDYGREMLRGLNRAPEEFDSIVYLKNGKLLSKSAAVLAILWDLGGLWKLTSIFKIVPSFMGDAVYDFVARNRYAWFGRTDACMMPTPELSRRFLS